MSSPTVGEDLLLGLWAASDGLSLIRYVLSTFSPAAVFSGFMILFKFAAAWRCWQGNVTSSLLRYSLPVTRCPYRWYIWWGVYLQFKRRSHHKENSTGNRIAPPRNSRKRGIKSISGVTFQELFLSFFLMTVSIIFLLHVEVNGHKKKAAPGSTG